MRIEDVQNLEMPGDITLGVARRYMMRHESVIAVGEYYGGVVRIRCLDEHDNELPDEMTLEEFRNLADQKRASLKLDIDDGRGGIKTMEHV